MSDGSGMAALYPSLIASNQIAQNSTDLPCIIKFGTTKLLPEKDLTDSVLMHGIRTLSEAEISNICNYIFYRWYPSKESLSESKVRELLSKCTM